MTVFVNIGRRVPRAWYKRTASKIGGLISFQENIWLIICQSMGLAKKKANASKTLDFIMVKDREDENLNYYLEWIKITIRGTKEQELEEYNEAMKMYDSLGKIFKQNLKDNTKEDTNLKKFFKTKILSMEQIEEAYKKGYGASESSNIAQKLLEMGILTHIEMVDDFATREVVIPKN